MFFALLLHQPQEQPTDESSETDNESERNGYNKTDRNQGIENYIENNNSVKFLSVNASNEISNPCKHRATAPSCWSVQQQEYFTSTYPLLAHMDYLFKWKTRLSGMQEH